MAARSILALVGLILTGGAGVLEFLVILAGAVDRSPVNSFWFLEADTTAINGDYTHWTYWNACPSIGVGGQRDLNTLCSVQAAYPFDPQNNFGTQMGVPAGFIGGNKFYLETRAMFAFAMISAFFTVFSFLFSLAGMAGRFGHKLAGLFAICGMIAQAICASLMTAAFVQGAQIFQGAGLSITYGQYAFGFQWAAFACLLFASVIFCIGGSLGGEGRALGRGKRPGHFDGVNDRDS